MRCAPSAPPATLPPLDREGDDETLNDDDVGGLLVPLDDLPSAADDDDLLTDPDFGIEAPSDPFANDRDTPVEIDIGAGFALYADEDASAPDDAAGLEQPFATGIDDTEEPLPPDAEERDGIDDGRGLLDGLELPDIDADEQGTDGDGRNFGLLVTADETSLPSAERPWMKSFLSPERERCGALAAADALVVAGSSDLLWLDRGRTSPVRLALEGTRITSLALVGSERDIALCVTSFGRLFRRARLGSDCERLHDWHRATEPTTAQPDSLELRQLGSDEPRAVLARLASGRLIRSDDEGSSFRPLEPPGRVSALSPNGSPLLALLDDGVALGLSPDGGRTWERRELPSPAREVAAGEAPLLSGSGSTIAIADAERGLVVSNDGGRTFSLVPGAAGVTACATGTLNGGQVVWAALYRETSDMTELALVNASDGSAVVIARLEASDEHDPEHAFEASRVEHLAWNGEQLYAAGGAGLVLFQPPSN